MGDMNVVVGAGRGEAPDRFVDREQLVRIDRNKDRASVRVDLVTLEPHLQVSVDSVDVNVRDRRHVRHTVLRPLPCTRRPWMDRVRPL